MKTLSLSIVCAPKTSLKQLGRCWDDVKLVNVENMVLLIQVQVTFSKVGNDCNTYIIFLKLIFYIGYKIYIVFPQNMYF